MTFNVNESSLNASLGFAKGAGDLMSDERTERLYLPDLGQLIKDMARDAKLDRDGSVGDSDQDLHLGPLMALHDVVSLMQEQAIAFGIDLRDLGLADIDAGEELSS